MIPEGNTRDFLDLGHQIIDDSIEEIWNSHTALSDFAVDGEPVGLFPVLPHTALSAVVEFFEQCGDLGSHTMELEDLPNECIVDRIKGSLKVNESNVEVAVFPELTGFLSSEMED